MAPVFTKVLAVALAEKGMTKTEFAKALGVSHGTVSKWASGQMVPRKKMAQRISAALGKSVEALGLAGNDCDEEDSLRKELSQLRLADISNQVADSDDVASDIERYQHEIAARERMRYLQKEVGDSEYSRLEINKLQFQFATGCNFENNRGRTAFAQDFDCAGMDIEASEILVMTDVSAYRGDGLYLLQLFGAKVVRRVQRTSAGFVVSSDSPAYEKLTISEKDLLCYAKVVGTLTFTRRS